MLEVNWTHTHARAPKTITDRLQRVSNAAARAVSDTRKFDRGMSRIMHSELHWLDVPERIKYKLGMLMYRCQHNKAPRYLMDHCTSVSDVDYRQRLGYSYVLPVVIKSLFHITDSVPKDVGHLPLLDRLSGTLCQRTCGIQRFLRTVTGTQWRRFYLCSTSVFSALEVFTRMRYINPHLTFDWKQPHHLRHVSVSHTEDNIFKTYYSQAKSTQMLSGEISRSNLHSVEWHLSV